MVSLKEAKLALGLDDTQSDKDEFVSRLINDISGLVEAYCDRQLKARDYTNEDYDGLGTEELYLNHYPVNSVTSIYDDANRDFTSSSLVDSDDYVFYDEGRVVLIAVTTTLTSTGFTMGYKNIRVSYNAGYATIPADLRMIVSEILIKKFKAYGDRTIGYTGISIGGQNISMTLGDLLPEHKMILDAKYRRKDFGR